MGRVTDQGRLTDQGQPDDQGQADEGTEDVGVDAGPQLDPPQVRVVHAVSDLTTGSPEVPIKGIRLCVHYAGLGVIVQPANSNPVPELFDLRDGVPHRAVTPYLATLESSTVRVYDEAVVDNDTPGALPPAVNCPTTGLDADCTDDAVPCLFQFPYDRSALADGSFSSLIVGGFKDNTAACPVVGVCPTGAIQAELVTDEDASDVVAGSSRVRFSQLIHNLLAPVDVCYDLDGLAMNAASPTLIHGNVLPGATTAYTTVPPVVTGMVFLTVKNPLDLTTPAGNCPLSSTILASGLPANVIPVFFSPANAQAGNPAPNVAAGTVLTIFATGDMRQTTRPAGAPPSVEWANYAGRTPIPLAFFEVEP